MHNLIEINIQNIYIKNNRRQNYLKEYAEKVSVKEGIMDYMVLENGGYGQRRISVR